jgi:hypothetical protein
MRTEREPLEIERLLPEDARRLQTATSAAMHLPASQAEECRALLNQLAAHRPRRRVSIGDVQRFHAWIQTSVAIDRDADIADGEAASQ